jgi:DNA-binding transcriptional MerR regulator
MNPLAHMAATNTHTLTATEMLEQTGLTRRQLSYLIRQGAVDPPEGRTKSARYGMQHVHQARFAKGKMDAGATAGEIGTSRRKRPSPTKRSEPKPMSSKECFQENVYRLTEHIRIVTTAELWPTERKVLSRLRAAGKLVGKERLAMSVEAATAAVG